MDSSLTDSSHLSAEGRQEGGGQWGEGPSLCWHQTSTQWQQMNGALWDCITSRPQCAAACERHSNVQAGHIPLVRALTCTSRVTRAKVTAPPTTPPTSPHPLPAAGPLSSPTCLEEHFEKGPEWRRPPTRSPDATWWRLQRRPLYLFLTAGTGR